MLISIETYKTFQRWGRGGGSSPYPPSGSTNDRECLYTMCISMEDYKVTNKQGLTIYSKHLAAKLEVLYKKTRLQ